MKGEDTVVYDKPEKRKKAESLGVEIITEEAFLEILNGKI